MKEIKYLIVILITISCDNKPKGMPLKPEFDTAASLFRRAMSCDTVYIHDTIYTRNIDVNYGDINLDNFKVIK